MTTKRNVVQALPRIVLLNISIEEFKNRLNQRIKIGEELYAREITNETDFSTLENEFDIWTDYNFEMLKQAFNFPDNEYRSSYDNAGFTFLGQMGEIANNPIQTMKNLIGYKLASLKSLHGKSDLIKSEVTDNLQPANSQKETTKTEVFIVHGHDELAKTKTARFIEKLGLKPIILHEQTSSGKTIIEKIEKYSNVGFGIVLYTPCDKGCKIGSEDNLLNRARQNVVFEHGFLIGKIGRDHVCALYKGEVELPNDISGMIYEKMDDDDSWHVRIARELKKSGYNIDLNRLI
jgi:predicted nucleotide-binding protein